MPSVALRAERHGVAKEEPVEPFHNIWPRMQPASDVRCLYSNKSCPNPRTTKKDGSLHRLCAYHQEKANNRQKQYLLKRKNMEERQAKQPAATAARPAVREAITPVLLEPIAFHDEEAKLSDHDVQMLAASMVPDEEDDDFDSDN
ncbi:hypothetical protein AC1031_006350 [Aphanomyces cochlioides]|nr:hypothetical protein AC1031_006350 [Aphanomyces cochlioides]